MKSLISIALSQESNHSDNPENMSNRSSRENSIEVDELPPPPNLGRLEAENGWQEVHGFLGQEEWVSPIKVCHCEKEARPGYVSKMAHEYEEDPFVLRQKVSLLASLILESRNCVVYSGAGISTSAGVSDYATKSKESSIRKPKLKSNLDAEPTLAHRALVEMHKAGLIKHWVQQNHDGLPQKAGFPQEHINEIHGAWYDPSNTVVPMSGSLRDDLFEDLLAWEDRADLTLSVGTSMCGMNSDRIFTTPAKKAKQGLTIGGVIIGIQRTQYDHLACLRIFAKIDDVMQMVLNELELYVEPYRPLVLSVDALQRTESSQKLKHVYSLPYDRNGNRIDKTQSSSDADADAGAAPIILDLRTGAKVKITSGPHAGDIGEVVGSCAAGHYRIRFDHLVKTEAVGEKGGGNSSRSSKPTTTTRKSVVRMLGLWWIESAAKGAVAHIPVVNASRRSTRR